MLVWLKFVLCAAVIAVTGYTIAKYGDIIAEKTGLGGVWIGVVLISITTSLPEVFTGIGSVAVVGQPDLTVGDLLGADAINVLKLGVLDFFSRAPLLGRTSPGNALGGAMSIAMVSLVALSILAGRYSDLRLGWVGAYTPLLVFGYLGMVKMIWEYERAHRDGNQPALSYEHVSAARAYTIYAVAGLALVAAGVYLAVVADEIAVVTGLGHSFVGSLMLGFITTLPEVAVGIAALRMGAIDILVGDTVGSNLFNMLVVAMDDLLFLRGPLLSHVSQGNLITALIVLLMSAVMVIGLLAAPQRKRFGVSWYAPILVGLFILGAFLTFRAAGVSPAA